ncbi:hypothetical protein [Noviherbaspirillum pedocola]|uniref:Uncharacterized protein n=1 Tax=Noviherbaspirillum pedocola TaxID=2801341 RepID=A0A934SVH9_9BURK|nr:hypothetical protein [Noviherbaspirillum pedocola]MBK4735906.1 hypothetical protein [Noviherbaspirillum pedocola]
MKSRLKTLADAGAFVQAERHAAVSLCKEAHGHLYDFLQVREVDMKFLFDHIRNYGIAGTLMYASHHVNTRPSMSFIPHFGEFAAAAFAVISIFLFIINFLHGGVAYRMRFGRPRLWIYAVLSVVWFLLMAELMELRVDTPSAPVPQVVQRHPM